MCKNRISYNLTAIDPFDNVEDEVFLIIGSILKVKTDDLGKVGVYQYNLNIKINEKIVGTIILKA